MKKLYLLLLGMLCSIGVSWGEDISSALTIGPVSQSGKTYSAVNGEYLSGTWNGGTTAVTIDGTSYSNQIKMESSTTLTIKTTKAFDVTFHFTGTKLKIDGTATADATNDILTITNLAAGTHTITRNSGTTNIYKIIFTEASSGSSSTPSTPAITYQNTKGADMSAYPTQYTEGTGIESFAALADVTGWHFTGWSPASISASATGNQAITAQWTASTTTITLDANTANNGSGDNQSVTATYEQALPSFTACTPASGYTLKGYYTAATEGTKVIAADCSLVASVANYTDANSKWINTAASVTLFAQYEEIPANEVYSAETLNAGTAFGFDGTYFSISKSNAPVTAGNSSAVTSDGSATYTKAFLPSGSTSSSSAYTLTAKARLSKIIVRYTMTDSKFSTNDQSKGGNLTYQIGTNDAVESSNTGNKSNTVAYEEVIEPTGGIAKDAVVKIYSSANRLAIFSVIVYPNTTPAVSSAITKGSSTNGDFTISPSGTQEEGTQITLAATPNSGYQLASWDVYKTGESATKVTVTNNKFTMPAYAVTVDATFEEYQEPTEVDFTINFTTNPYTITGTHMSATTVSGSWHDNQHGYSSPTVTVPIPGMAKVTVATCEYNGTENIQILNGSTELFSTAAKTTSCSEVVYNYTGSATTLTIKGGKYCHYVKVATIDIEDIASKNAAGTQYEVTAGSARNLKACIAAAATDASCKVVYIPNGTYDFGTEENITISGSGLHIIGQSMENVIIKNTPAAEALKKALFKNTGTGNIFEDLTLQSYAPWGGSAERAHALWDEGSQTICKNVYLKGYQDTYFSNNTNMKYFEGGKIEGTTDFICGGGKIFFESVELICTTSANKTNNDVIIAPDADTHSGTQFIFNHCAVTSSVSYYLGRSWKGENTATFANCTMQSAYSGTNGVNPSAASSGTLEITLQNTAAIATTFFSTWNPQTSITGTKSMTVQADGYTSFSSEHNVIVPEGVTVYGGELNDNVLALHEVTFSGARILPAHTGFIMKANVAFELTYTTKAATNSSVINNLSAATGKTYTGAANTTYYVLSYQTDATKYCQYTGSYIPAGKAYLTVTTSSAPSRISLVVAEPSVATELDNVEANNEAVKFIENGQILIRKNGVVYNALGQIVK